MPNPHPIKPFYRQNLPHIQPVGETFFVTFRLQGSLPAHLIYQLKKELDYKVDLIQKEEETIEAQIEKIERERALFFKKYDQHLDACKYDPTHLKTKEIAEIVMKQIHRFDGDLYELFAYCIMPNHVHLLIGTSIQLPNGYFPMSEIDDLNLKPLYEIMRRIKGASAKYANDFLGKRGEQFWQHESYDHYIRNTKSFQRVVAYIVNNPIAAKLVMDWKDWPYTYMAPKYLDS